MKEQSSTALKTGGRTVSLFQSLLYRYCLFFSNSFLDNNILCNWLLKVLLQLFSSNNHALYIVCLGAGFRERPPWPLVVWLCKEAALTFLGGSEFLNAWLLWSSTKHAGTALRGLWIFYISSVLSVWTQNIPFITSSCTQTVVIHFPLCASRWLSQVRFLPLIVFQYKDVTVYFRH